jgi:O-antigen/teichoic acid export membrane protein
VLFSAMAGNVDQILNMTENQNIFRNITIFSFFVNLLLSYLLIPKYNIEGAAIASLITNILINVLCLYFIKKKLGFYTLF